jgi:hypothetical protein
MLNPFQFVPAGIVPRLAAGKPYTLLLSKTGENTALLTRLRLYKAGICRTCSGYRMKASCRFQFP